MRLSSIVYFIATTASALGSGLSPRQAAGGGKLISTTIGVRDLNKSLKFYRDSLGMKVLDSFSTPVYKQIDLQIPGSKGMTFSIAKWNNGWVPASDGTTPVKLVFFCDDTDEFAAAVRHGGGSITYGPDEKRNGYARDLDGYILEFNIKEGTGLNFTSTSKNVFTTVGIGGENLNKTLEFYTDTVGLDLAASAYVPGLWDEHVLGFSEPGSSTLVVMHWFDGKPRNYKNVPVKFTIALRDVKGWIKHFKSKGGKILREPKKRKGRETLRIAQDLNGYLIELVGLLGAEANALDA